MLTPALKPLVAAAALAACAHASAQITFYEKEGFRGDAFTTSREVRDLTRENFNDKASSAVVDRGRWEVCEDARFGGRCAVLRRGSYDSMRDLGLHNQISSVRPVSDNRRYDNEAPAPLASPNYEYRRRPNERTYEAQVTSARAVVGPPEQRCWVERQPGERPDLNVGGGVIGGVLGGILGHQIGGGGGKTAATIGGALGGAALGANVDRIRDRDSGREVRRCESSARGNPEYWDVTYNYKGVEHRVQMASPPGRTIAVNARGEPRE
ncbi:beta/gamma crystallin family protein [Piscinibacter koreensis]|uniref:Beta/gamma crystallin family protein n=1 Tax=Piscinibacter koreensis TaxID=2742824 RepID=A0A7Y6NJB7_9BURK|nr:beta/gamma crystallin family protein [Schlegelella koreensis]NUZ04246.1 beta/gamma crystallin family protein [Schlegelella koreensis]